jgi:hypothetical protein
MTTITLLELLSDTFGLDVDGSGSAGDYLSGCAGYCQREQNHSGGDRGHPPARADLDPPGRSAAKGLVEAELSRQ